MVFLKVHSVGGDELLWPVLPSQGEIHVRNLQVPRDQCLGLL